MTAMFNQRLGEEKLSALVEEQHRFSETNTIFEPNHSLFVFIVVQNSTFHSYSGSSGFQLKLKDLSFPNNKC